MVRRIRLDQLMIRKGLAKSNKEAELFINSKKIKVKNFNSDNLFPHTMIEVGSELIIDSSRFVSRGGEKLDNFFNDVGINFNFNICIDIGASTGGFTDVLLKNGANNVYCIDSGINQIHPSLQRNPNVFSYEKVNAKYEIKLPIKKADLIVMDVSFISTLKIIPNLIKFMKNESKIIVLIKPQFEAIRSQVEAGGIISNPYIHAEVLNNLLIEYKKLGLSFIEVKKSRVLGRKGNQEFFCVLKIL
ncbi:MAG: TlyA family rRNA (cytidine-2'-O)-methyltransferase [Dehalococcoidia bacterium]|nr:TlyA family rRNA (cytidine-2'-O)-methyltransferase [Dehalococcoidia bacterium]MQG04692.1 TlyA family RNA methyltransferase [SAR202 cluster bacterium]|tara:strand:+ start:143 stop:877 length:735 start_codon:yes stop_codon:yes gene_type:complete